MPRTRRTGFLPSTGPAGPFPTCRADVRVDTGVEEGDAVTPFYDPMIAKLIAHGRHREEAIGRAGRGLRRRSRSGR